TVGFYVAMMVKLIVVMQRDMDTDKICRKVDAKIGLEHNRYCGDRDVVYHCPVERVEEVRRSKGTTSTTRHSTARSDDGSDEEDEPRLPKRRLPLPPVTDERQQGLVCGGVPSGHLPDGHQDGEHLRGGVEGGRGRGQEEDEVGAVSEQIRTSVTGFKGHGH